MIRTTSRLFYFDVARALLMLLGLPYHIARIYGSGRDNIIVSDDRSPALNLLAEFLHSFRMEAFFAVAGFFSLLILSRSHVGHWLRGRIVRIGMPLLFGGLLFWPINSALVTLAKLHHGQVQGSFGKLFAAQMTTVGPHILLHLWFLQTLMGLTIALAVGAAAARHWPAIGRALTMFRRQAGRLLHRSPALIAMVFALFAWPFWMSPPIIERLFGIELNPLPVLFLTSRFIQFLPFFLIGCLLAARRRLLNSFVRPNALCLPVAIAASCLFVIDSIMPLGPIAGISICIAGMFWLQSILAFGASRLDRHNPLIAYLCDASFTIYLFHMPVAMTLGLLFLDIGWPPVVEFTIILTLTLIASTAIHEVVRRSSVLSFAFNGVSPGKFARKRSANVV